jgi:hypothetical protein
VYMETSRRPGAVKWERYVSGVPASMVLVEQQQPPQLVDGFGAPNSPGSSTSGLRLRILAAVLLVALALAWRQRRLTHSA